MALSRCLKCRAVINPAVDNRLVRVVRDLVMVDVIGKRTEIRPIGEETKGYEHRQGFCYPDSQQKTNELGGNENEARISSESRNENIK